jgi:hypothetical protein
MPSREEVLELVNKANEKTVAYEEAVNNAKPHFDKINPKFVVNYLEAASTAHTLIQAIQKDGPSAYGLVSLLATLDDMSLNASTGSVQLLRTDEEKVAKGAAPNVSVLASVIALGNASTACTDISELILHATLRYVNVEEHTLGKVAGLSKMISPRELRNSEALLLDKLSDCCSVPFWFQVNVPEVTTGVEPTDAA